jgi:hypothetical protein
MKQLALIAALALALSACGGSSRFESPPLQAGPPAPPVSMIDAFFAAVRSLVASSPDDTEPVSIDAVAVTAPEDSEPAPVQ